MGLLGAVGLRLDPQMGYNFTINLIDSSSTMALVKSAVTSAVLDTLLGGFSECSGLEMSLDVEEYQEGGNNGTVLKFPTRVKWANLVLKHGIGAGSGLWDWHYDFTQGKGKRKDGVITLLNDLHVPTHIWHFRRGLPVRYTGPTLNAASSTVAIEAIEIAHEGLYQVPFVGYAGAAVSLSANVSVTGGF